MIKLLEETNISCPYCGESFAISIDCTAGNQQYIEDCYVCCKPIVIHTNIDNDGNVESIDVKREDD